MKINKYIGMAVCSWLMIACQNDDMDGMQPQDSEQYTLIGQIVNNDADSRAQIELGCKNEGAEYFFWNEKDRFTLYQKMNNEWTAGELVISENYSEADGGALNAEFTSTTALTPSAVYSAVYPVPESMTNGMVELAIQTGIDFSSATTDAQRAELWKKYFTENMFMVASGTLSESGRNYIPFKHLCSLARITYVNQTGSEQQINGVSLKGQNLGIKLNYSLENNTGEVTQSSSDFVFQTKGLTVADKGTVDLYILFFPKAIEKTDLKITIQQSTGNKNLSLPWKDILAANGNNESFRAGMRYWFDVTDTEQGLVWTKNTAEDGWIVFKDKQFSAALSEALGSYKVLMTEDGFAKINTQHVASVNELDFTSLKTKVSTLNGIEMFKNLRILKANNLDVEMDMLDLSAMYFLSHVELGGNKLKALKLPVDSWTLKYLDCHDNLLTKLDITGLKTIHQEGTLLCGSQKDDIKLMLIMTDAQKEMWNSSWKSKNPGVVLEGEETSEVKYVADYGKLVEALADNSVRNIILTAPINISVNENLRLSFGFKNISVIDDFWDKYDSAINITKSKDADANVRLRVDISGASGKCKFNGATSKENKYFIKSNSVQVHFNNATFNLGDKLNAVCVEYASTALFNSIINVSSSSFAIDVLTNEEVEVMLNLDEAAQIKGQIRFILGPGYGIVSQVNVKGKSSINGKLIVEGNRKRLIVNNQGGTIEGDGWLGNDNTGDDNIGDDPSQQGGNTSGSGFGFEEF